MKNNLPTAFILPYLLFLLVGAFFYFFTDKIQAHLYVNQYHHTFLDILFSYITYLGDGYFVVITSIIVSFFNFRLSVLILSAYVFSAGITQGLKHLLFSDWMRPAGVFETSAQLKELYLVPGIELNYHHSFPSGHSTSAFSLFYSLSLFSSKKILQFILFCLAVLAAFSRVYLSQHFFIDIYAGSFIGIVCSLLLYHFWIADLNEKYNQPLFNLIK
ncbi:MAG: phosphatase PAP2 family protein [Bacteroidia bacterium]